MFYNRIYFTSRNTFIGIRKRISYKRNFCSSAFVSNEGPDSDPDPNPDPNNNVDKILTFLLLSTGFYLANR